MSRGLGAVQREVLERLDIPDRWAWTTLRELAGPHPTKARLESMRRALHKLAAAGQVETKRLYDDGGNGELAARLALRRVGPLQNELTRVRDIPQQTEIEELRAILGIAGKTR